MPLAIMHGPALCTCLRTGSRKSLFQMAGSVLVMTMLLPAWTSASGADWLGFGFDNLEESRDLPGVKVVVPAQTPAERIPYCGFEMTFGVGSAMEGLTVAFLHDNSLTLYPIRKSASICMQLSNQELHHLVDTLNALAIGSLASSYSTRGIEDGEQCIIGWRTTAIKRFSYFDNCFPPAAREAFRAINDVIDRGRLTATLIPMSEAVWKQMNKQAWAVRSP